MTTTYPSAHPSTYPNTHQLDQTYTALAEATTRVGEGKAALFLATLALALLSRQTDASVALALISQAERLSST